MSEVMGHTGGFRSLWPGRGWRVWMRFTAALCFLIAGHVRGDGVALNFFTNTAGRLVRYSTARWCAQDPVDYANTFGGLTNGFSLTNIPVRINGQFVYTPAVNRLLQLSANLYEATTNTFYPAVYRPDFFKDANGNVFISGYHQIDSPVTPGVAPLDPPTTLNGLPMGYASGFQNNAGVNVYGIPWIIGAKKFMPNFNQFYMNNSIQVTRKLQVNRPRLESWNKTTSGDFTTNQVFIMDITNTVGFSFWNSYRTNYPGGTPIIFASDILYMILTNVNGKVYLNPATNIFYITNFNSVAGSTWPGAQWNLNLNPQYRSLQASPSFLYSGGNFVPMPPQQYSLSSDGFFPLPSTGSVFNTNDNLLLNLPQMGLTTSNWFYAYIVDVDSFGNGHLIDYVEFTGPNSGRSINNELYDYYPGSNIPPYDMWYTNASGSTFNGPSQGIVNQINVSQTGTGYPANSWRLAGNLPPGVPETIANEAGYFRSFFIGGAINVNGTLLNNTNLQAQAPYTPTRTMSQITVWQANDPLVHYLASDLNDVSPFTGLVKSDNPTQVRTVSQNSVNQSTSTTIQDDRYQPWGCNFQLGLLPGVDTNAFNLAYRDPLIYGPDDWDFPTNFSSSPDWIGRIHRGTPWQTIYLKATNILAYANVSGISGLLTWTNWTGNGILYDAANSAPVNDHGLMTPLMELFNTNDIRTLISVNDSVPSDWLGQLDGFDVLTNSTPDFVSYASPISFDDLIISSNSPTATVLYNAIQTMRSTQAGGNFASIGALLQAPQLAEQSPFLNTSDAQHIAYSISDEAYERIAAQLIYRVRADSVGSALAGGSQISVQFTGGDGYAYAIQASPDLVHWTSICTNYPVNDVIDITIPTGRGAQYFRSVLLP